VLAKQKNKKPRTIKTAETANESSKENSKINDADYAIAISNADIQQRYAAVNRIKKQALLAYIAEDNVDPRIAHAALSRITLPSLLKDIAGRAAYASVRKVSEARHLQQWRKDLTSADWRATEGAFGRIEYRVSVQNKNPELAYKNIGFQPSHFYFTSGPGLPLNGTVGPGSSVDMDTSSCYNSTVCFESKPLLLSAEPVLPAQNEKEPVLIGWKALKQAKHQNSGAKPEICDEAVIGSTVQSNVLAEIVKVTTHIVITAADPNFDELTYSWSASNGTIRKNGSPVVYWDRPVENNGHDNGRMKPGSITVVVSNSSGEKAEKTFRLDYP
jgi:hypothetical protein